MELLTSGDESAFNQIYERYWELLLGMAFNRLRYLHEAEDAVHDVFVSLWKTRETQKIISLKSYLAVSLKYIVLRIIYRKKLFDAFTSRNHSEDVTYNDNSIEDREVFNSIQKEMDRLPEKCKIIFQMSRIEGLPNSEIALRMNVSGKTVENQINKAQGKLRLSLKNHLGLFAAMFFFF